MLFVLVLILISNPIIKVAVGQTITNFQLLLQVRSYKYWTDGRDSGGKGGLGSDRDLLCIISTKVA